MKKNFIFSMLAGSLMVFNANAQKDYNMVITLQNGTTVTLGHNDIKEIMFNDGQVSVSGNVVTTIDELREMIVSNSQAIDNINDPKNGLAANVKAELNSVKAMITSTDQRIDEITDTKSGILSMMRQQLNDIEKRIKALEGAE